MSSETIAPSVATAVPLTTIASGSVSNDVLTWDGSKWASLQIPPEITYENLTGTTTANTALTPLVDNDLMRGSTSLPWTARITCNNFYSTGGNFYQSAMLSNGYVTGFASKTTINAYNADGTLGVTGAFNSGQEAAIAVYSKAGVVQWVARCKNSSAYIRKASVATDASDNIYVVFPALSAGTATVYNADGTAFGTTLVATGGAVILAKYNSAGVVQWATYIDSATDSVDCAGIVYWNGNIYLVGVFRGALTAYNVGGASGGTLTYVASGNECYVCKYNSSGIVQWVAKVSSAGSSSNGTGIDVNEYGVFVATNCASTVTFYNAGEVSSGVTVTASGNSDGFAVKYSDSGIFQYYTRISAPGTFGFTACLLKLTSKFVYVTFHSDVTVYPCHANGSRFKRILMSGSDRMAILMKYSYSGECLDAYRLGANTSQSIKSITANDYGVLVAHDWAYPGYYLNSDDTQYGPQLTVPSGIATAGMAFYSHDGRVLWMNWFKYTSNIGRTVISDCILDGTDVYTNITYDVNNIVIAMPVGSTAITPPVKVNTSDVFLTKFNLACLFTLATPSSNKIKLITNDTLIDGTIIKITPSTSFTYKSKSYTSILLPRKGSSVTLLWNSSSWTVIAEANVVTYV